MDTEIKFRIWSEIWPKIYTTDDFHDPKNSNLLNRYESQYVKEDFESALMQFTGLNDKNGREIYESDFIKDNEEIYLVCFGEWEYAGLEIIGWYCKNKSGSFPLSKADCEKMEVIGNFYENIELSDI